VKTLTVTVHNRILRITTADVSTPENRTILIKLTTNMKSPIIKVSLGYGYSDGFFSRLDYLRPLLEIPNKVIGLTATPIKNIFFQLTGFAIVGKITSSLLKSWLVVSLINMV
jgi:hypothetical protein